MDLRHPSPGQAFPEFAVPAGMSAEQFPAMGTTVSLLLPREHARKALEAVRGVFGEWEQTLSRFLPESELSRLNRSQGTPVAVSDLLFSVLTTALIAASETGGVYDPTLLPQLISVGYDRSFADMPPVQLPGVASIRPGGGWRDIHINPRDHRVTLPPGLQLDFGGIAKGMAVDEALALLRDMQVGRALVNAGGDLAVLGLPPDASAWPVAVQGKDAIWTVPFRRGAMATSGIGRRHWRQGDVVRHHLLDPQTGLPAQTDLWSVTVVGDHCTQTEVAAKVAFIQGSERGATFLRAHDLSGLFVHEDGSWSAVGHWPITAMHTRTETDESGTA